MTSLFPFCILVLLVAQFTLPRRYAFIPLLVAVCHLPNTPVAGLTPVRLVILAGLLRASIDSAALWTLRHPLNRLMALWALWMILSGFGHQQKPGYDPLTLHTGIALGFFGSYLYARAYLRSPRDCIAFCKGLAFVLIPLALLLLMEKTTGRNMYAILGTPNDQPWIRGGHVRPAGPFGNAILAGLAGAVCLPLVAGLPRVSRTTAALGLAACLVIVLASGSSTPVMSALVALLALAAWGIRNRMRQVRVAAVVSIIALSLVMNAPIWYLFARIDVAGGSTSWHRAELISQALDHAGEWWLIGTDYTRHWMPYGLEWSADHADITNQYIQMGVYGGFLLMGLFIWTLVKAFQLIGARIRTAEPPVSFLLWCFGSCLFVHAMTFMGIAYFDQSYVLYCLPLGAIPGLCVATASSGSKENVRRTAPRDEATGLHGVAF